MAERDSGWDPRGGVGDEGYVRVVLCGSGGGWGGVGRGVAGGVGERKVECCGEFDGGVGMFPPHTGDVDWCEC